MQAMVGDNWDASRPFGRPKKGRHALAINILEDEAMKGVQGLVLNCHSTCRTWAPPEKSAR
jgi:hypothetical protein